MGDPRLGSRLKEVRTAAGLTQQGLADKAGVLLALLHVVCPLQSLGFEYFEDIEFRGLVSCPMVARG